MAITLKTSTNKALKETTVSAYDSRGLHICSETQGGIGARVTAQLSALVHTAAERIQRAEQARPAYHIIDVPGMAVQSVAYPQHGA
jgi:hypothetical protein